MASRFLSSLQSVQGVNLPGGDLPPPWSPPAFLTFVLPFSKAVSFPIRRHRGDALDEEIMARARAAGLDLALRDFPEDVEAAAGDAQVRRVGFCAVKQPEAEPWPPMQAGNTL
jgi:hypothetical protein